MVKILAAKVSHYYSKIGVAVIDVIEPLNVEDSISIEGATTNVKQTIKEMQFNHKRVMAARPGDQVGLKVKDKVRSGDNIYKE